MITALYALLYSTIFASLPNTDVTPINPEKFVDWSVIGPSGGDVRVIAVDPRDKNHLYISTLDGQIHTSSDAGKSWRLLVNLNEPGLVLDQLFVDSQDSKIIYASGHRHKSPGGFFRSTDGGVTWKESGELKNEAIQSMTQSDFDPNVIIVGTINGVWTSKNKGGSWEKIVSPSMPVNIDSLAIDPRNTSTIYAGTWWRAYKTTDSGKSWRLIKDGMIDDSDVFAVDIDKRNPDHIIASACSGIYESQNAGEKWSKFPGIPSSSRRTRDILQHPTMPGVVYAATTEGFWMTANAGKSWTLSTQRNLEINSIAVHPDEPNRVYIGTNSYGVMVSNDGGRSFSESNGNFSSRFTYGVTPDVSQRNRLYAAVHNIGSGGGFMFVSNDGGNRWQQVRGIDNIRVTPFAVLQDRDQPENIYLGTNVGLFRSADRGNSWTQITAPKPAAPRKVIKKAPAKTTAKATVKTPPKTTAKSTLKKPSVPVAKKTTPVSTPVAAVPTGPKLIPAITEKIKILAFTEDGKKGILAGTDEGLYRTYDITKGWEKLTFPIGVNENVFAIHISKTRPDTMWVGTATSGVLVSRDDGKTWTKVGGAPDLVPISSIVTDPRRPDYVYVGTAQTFYLSRDGGGTWSRRGGNLPLGNFTSILLNPNNSDEILIASSLETDGGVFISTDAGNRWKRVDTKDMNLASRRIWNMAFDPTDTNRIFAGTHSSGVYRIERKANTASAEPTPNFTVNGNEQ